MHLTLSIRQLLWDLSVVCFRIVIRIFPPERLILPRAINRRDAIVDSTTKTATSERKKRNETMKLITNKQWVQTFSFRE
jgi:hypothetical protein